MDIDLQVRSAAFNWLSEQVNSHGDVLAWNVLLQGFEFQGQRVPLVSPQGIFKPKILKLPISIATTPKGPYNDFLGKDNFLIYRYRGKDPNQRDNVGLREVFRQGLPLVYFHGFEPGKYLANFPVYIIGDDPRNLTFRVSIDDYLPVFGFSEANLTRHVAEVSDARHAYLTSTMSIGLYAETL